MRDPRGAVQFVRGELGTRISQRRAVWPPQSTVYTREAPVTATLSYGTLACSWLNTPSTLFLDFCMPVTVRKHRRRRTASGG